MAVISQKVLNTFVGRTKYWPRKSSLSIFSWNYDLAMRFLLFFILCVCSGMGGNYDQSHKMSHHLDAVVSG